jgi:phage protein D
MTLMPLENQKIGKHLSHIRIATRDQMRALKDPQDRNDMRYIIAQAKLLEKQTRTLVADAKRVHDRATRRKILEDAMVMFRLAEKGLKQIQRSWKIGTEGSYLDQLLQMDTHDVYGGIWGFVEGIRKTYRIKMVRVKGRRFKAYGVK